ncbi:MAG TPA: hypothetical protein VM487_20520 [Phycisphaerae bacterium]|nr:hypothetical protein [Phycisphaerae bacterium]
MARERRVIHSGYTVDISTGRLSGGPRRARPRRRPAPYAAPPGTPERLLYTAPKRQKPPAQTTLQTPQAQPSDAYNLPSGPGSRERQIEDAMAAYRKQHNIRTGSSFDKVGTEELRDGSRVVVDPVTGKQQIRGPNAPAPQGEHGLPGGTTWQYQTPEPSGTTTGRHVLRPTENPVLGEAPPFDFPTPPPPPAAPTTAKGIRQKALQDALQVVEDNPAWTPEQKADKAGRLKLKHIAENTVAELEEAKLRKDHNAIANAFDQIDPNEYLASAAARVRGLKRALADRKVGQVLDPILVDEMITILKARAKRVAEGELTPADQAKVDKDAEARKLAKKEADDKRNKDIADERERQKQARADAVAAHDADVDAYKAELDQAKRDHADAQATIKRMRSGTEVAAVTEGEDELASAIAARIDAKRRINAATKGIVESSRARSAVLRGNKADAPAKPGEPGEPAKPGEAGGAGAGAPGSDAELAAQMKSTREAYQIALASGDGLTAAGLKQEWERLAAEARRRRGK